MTKLENNVLELIENKKQIFIDASHDISAHPELQNQEFYACKLLTDILAKEGFEITINVAGHETGFIAKKCFGDGPSLVYLAEYDALPVIGHGCGHNIIGTLSCLAAVGLGGVLENTGGTVYVYGTPAEEGGDNGSAKGSFVKAGLFEGIDAAMLIHPDSDNYLTTESLAVKCYRFEFFGQTAHAAACPQDGINALDAMILFYNGINALRQQCTPDIRIHGVITKGGEAPNVIPGYTEAKFFIRASKRDACNDILNRVIKVAEGAAIATGCTYKAEPFNNDVDDTVLYKEFDLLYKENAAKIGIDYEFADGNKATGSSDVGNVSYVIPTIQPRIKVTNQKIPAHTIEFTQACISSLGDEALVNGAKILALTGLDLLTDKEKLERIKVTC